MIILTLTIFISIGCMYIHKIILNTTNNIFLILLSHVSHVLFFSFIYALETNNMMGNHNNIAIDLFYYSFCTYTTLGVGDIYFNGYLRVTSGFESLIGLFMIAWSSAHIYKVR